jgi:hypothetical protein
LQFYFGFYLNPEDQHRHLHRHENLKSHIGLIRHACDKVNKNNAM